MRLKHNKPRKLLFLIICLLSVYASNAQVRKTIESDYAAKRLFVQNFMKYVLWPNNEFGTDFIITVVGDDNMYSSLRTHLDETNFRGRKVIVKYVKHIDKLSKCSIIYLPKEKSSFLSKTKELIGTNSTLLITDGDGLGKKGSGINFIKRKNVLSFEMNVASLEDANLKVSNMLKSVAIII